MVSQVVTLPDPIGLAAQQLAALKAQLQQALSRVEAQERAIEEQMRPQTLGDVEILEQKLVEALEELRARKAELRGETGKPADDDKGKEKGPAEE